MSRKVTISIALAEEISDILHRMEACGFELTLEEDSAWADLTEAILEAHEQPIRHERPH